MRKIALPGASLLFASLLLAGCAAEMGGYSGASVTRFHLGQQIARGPIAVEPAESADANSLEFDQIARSVERELARQGWAVDERTGGTEQVAVVRVDQAARQGRRGGGVSIGVGVGGASFGRRSAVGGSVGATVPVTGNRRGEVVATLLSVRIQRRSDATVAWEGRAEMEAPAGSPYASRNAAADRLAAALFRDFPGESGRTIRVR
ncbi:MAG TPA: DUF4136 domain-containing protein [Allosphingosinicella sp.]|nr:DUF4136 domain-containing protein [Allosphingosinicella sp.]